jgi:hypothetical protein
VAKTIRSLKSTLPSGVGSPMGPTKSPGREVEAKEGKENKSKKINRIISFRKRWFSFMVFSLLSLRCFYLLLIKLFLLVVFPSSF